DGGRGQRRGPPRAAPRGASVGRRSFDGHRRSRDHSLAATLGSVRILDRDDRPPPLAHQLVTLGWATHDFPPPSDSSFCKSSVRPVRSGEWAAATDTPVSTAISDKSCPSTS